MFTRVVAAATVRITKIDGVTIGTAFFVSREGEIITCDHVVALAGGDSIVIVAANGRSEEIETNRIQRIPDLDVAVIHSTTPAPDVVPLATGTTVPGLEFWTSGFQYGDIGVTSAFPLTGTVSGVTSVRYDTYAQPAVMVLTNAAIDHGLSGGPLADANSGAVIGIVVAKIPDGLRHIGGFAVPTSRLVKHPQLRSLIERNRAEIPAFGEYSNALGVSKLACAQIERAIGILTSSRLFLPDQQITREDFRRVAEEFRKSSAQLLPVIGYSGTGKTSALAALAKFLVIQDGLALLLRGVDLAGGSLSDAINAALHERAAPLAVATVDERSWFRALSESGKRLTVLLDGLNEASAVIRQDIEGWLSRSFVWMAEKPVQCVVTCRPEFWEPIESIFRNAPVSVHFPENEGAGSKPTPFRMPDFSESEVQMALEVYGLSEAAVSSDEVSHPSLLRIYSEVAEDRKNAALSFGRYVIFDRFVKLKLEAVARKRGTLVKIVENRVSKAAQIAFISRSNELALDRFFSTEVFGGTLEISQDLIMEHIFIETSSGYRFAFDEVAEFIQSRFVDLTLLPQFANESDGYALGAASFALLRLEHEGKLDELRTHISYLLELPNSSRWVFWQLVRTLSWLENPAVLADEIVKFGRKLDEDDLELILSEVPLPLTQTFQLMRALAVFEASYDWEPKHWHDHLMGWPGGIRPIFEAQLKRDRRFCFEQLLNWVGDKTSLRDGDETLSNVALGLLFKYRHLDLEFIAESLAPVATDSAFHFFYRIADHSDLSELLPILESWADRADRQRVALIVTRHFLNTGRYSKNVAIDILSRIRRATSDAGIAATVVEALTCFAEMRSEESFQALVSAFRSRDLSAQRPYMLLRFADSHFEQILAILDELYFSGLEGTEATISDLSGFEGDDDQRLRVLDIVQSAWTKYQQATLDVARFVENRCYKEQPGTPIYQRVQQMGIDLTQSSVEPAVRRVLMYAATAKGPSGYHSGQLPFVDSLIETAVDAAELCTLARSLASLEITVPSSAEQLDRILNRIGPNSAVRLVLKAGTTAAMDRVLARWFREGKLPVVGDYLPVIAQALMAGEDASAAAAQARLQFRKNANSSQA